MVALIVGLSVALVCLAIIVYSDKVEDRLNSEGDEEC